jgi:hypothetical protein
MKYIICYEHNSHKPLSQTEKIEMKRMNEASVDAELEETQIIKALCLQDLEETQINNAKALSLGDLENQTKQEMVLLHFREQYFLEVAITASKQYFSNETTKRISHFDNMITDTWTRVLHYTDELTRRSFRSAFKKFSTIRLPEDHPCHVKCQLKYVHYIDHFPEAYKNTQHLELVVPVPIDFSFELPKSLINVKPKLTIIFDNINLDLFEQIYTSLSNLWTAGANKFNNPQIKLLISTRTNIDGLRNAITVYNRLGSRIRVKVSVYYYEGGFILEDYLCFDI